MKLRLQFGPLEPPRDVNWWQPIESFPVLVLYKDKKWEFFMYADDPAGQVAYICQFSQIQTWDPNWHATTYESLDYLFGSSSGPKCECGSIYSGFSFDHMRYSPMWIPWSKL